MFQRIRDSGVTEIGNSSKGVPPARLQDAGEKATAPEQVNVWNCGPVQGV